MVSFNNDLNSLYIKKDKKGVSSDDKGNIETLCKEYFALNKKKDTLSNKKKEITLKQILGLFTPFLKSTVKKHSRYVKDINSQKDILQEAYYGLVYGLNKFDDTYDNSVITYIYNWVERYIQKYLIERKSIVRNNSLYYPLYVFIRDKLVDGCSEEDIYTFFPKSPKNNWLEVPDFLKLKNKLIKPDTIKKHIDSVVNARDNFTVYQTPINANYIEQKAFDTSNQEIIYSETKTEKNKNSSGEIYEVVFNLKMFSNIEKNIFFEYNDLEFPLLPIELPMDVNTEVKMFEYLHCNVSSSKINKNTFIATKYDINRGYIKKIVSSITDEIKKSFLKKEFV